MGLFSKIKNMFKREEKEEHIEEEKLEEEKEEIEEEQINDEFEEDTELNNEEEIDDHNELSNDDLEESETEEDNDEVEEELEEDIDEDIEEDLEEESKQSIDEPVEKEDTEESSIDEEEDSDKENKVTKVDTKSVKVYEKGLTKTRESFVSRLISLTKRHNKVDDEYFDELEEILIMADIGIDTVMSFMDRLRKRVRNENIEDLEYLKEVIVDELFVIYVNDSIIVNKVNMAKDGPTVILFVGVNGVGKTTTIAKLASKFHDEGKKVMMVGGDTFRAGAVKQLEEWAEKTGSLFVGKKEGTDPASVIYDGLVKAKEENVDVVLIDTAGRLQNKDYLMKELEKINKVIGKIIDGAPHETLLVIDATTGQNGISQAKAFKEITNVTGIVLTKLDGTAKGGIVLAIKENVGIPVKYIGLGERKEDLQVFDIEKYIYGLFKDMM